MVTHTTDDTEYWYMNQKGAFGFQAGQAFVGRGLTRCQSIIACSVQRHAEERTPIHLHGHLLVPRLT